MTAVAVIRANQGVINILKSHFHFQLHGILKWCCDFYSLPKDFDHNKGNNEK